MKTLPILGGAAALALSLAAHAVETPSLEAMWQLIQQQQQQIDALQSELQSAREAAAQAGQKVAATEQKVLETAQKIDATDAMLEQVADSAGSGSGSSWFDRTHVGGYGELHYNGGNADKVDFHRFVLFVGHQFNDDLRMMSEFEVEHSLAGDGKPGEVEIEQAYLEMDLARGLRGKAGLFLVPVGLINETHEPPTFFGVERNPVESNIIPSTWWEAGVALSGELAPGWSFDSALHSGLKTTGGSRAYAIRGGRQKVAEALAEDPAFTGRIKYTGINGLELAATVNYQQDITQGLDPLAGSALLFETHAAWQRNGFGLKALWARWSLDGEGPEAIGADVQDGFFVEPSYRVNDRFGVFARWNQWDNLAGDTADSEWQQTDLGINYWPHPQVVLKADYQFQDAPTGKSDDDRVNFGVGYQF